MITLISICDLFWLLWLLPLLLGMLLTWLYWRNKYANMVAEYDGKIKGLNGKISGLEADLSECRAKRADLEGDLSITKGRMREIESDMKTLQATASKKIDITSDSKYINMVADYDGKVKGLNGKISGLESDLAACKAKRGELENDLSSTKSKLGEKEEEIKGLQAKASKMSASTLAASAPNLSSTVSSIAATPTPEATPTPTPEAPKAPEPEAKKSIFSGVKSDNLQIIEGIGPKMESVLKENGVNTHAELAAQTPDSLNTILGKYGDKYKIIDPTTWAQQASYAAKNDFEGLIDLQKKLDTGKDTAAGLTDSKLEKYLIKTGALKAFKQDDLKAIEGIGPATEKLLHGNGIKTWRELANTDATAIKAMLTAAGSRFALGDPTTWPKQAEMAADGKFDELREYQDFLDGGRG